MTRYNQFKAELAARPQNVSPNRHRHQLETRYGYSAKVTAETRTIFVNCVEAMQAVKMIAHPTLDIALLQFQGFTRLLCDSFPVFARDTTPLKQGKFLCRLGFPFPEFTNFSYDPVQDAIDWNNMGRTDSPRFPIEGMLTRHLIAPDGRTVGFEMSTPGLRGQSGGPAFDTEGRIWGMQSATNHLDLDFDVDQEVLRNGEKKKVADSAFLHVGHCIHAEMLKEFMRSNNVRFAEQ